MRAVDLASKFFAQAGPLEEADLTAGLATGLPLPETFADDLADAFVAGRFFAGDGRFAERRFELADLPAFLFLLIWLGD